MSQPRLNPDLTVNQVLLEHPGSIAVFNRLGIDACCGGGDTLAQAAADGPGLARLMAALDEAIKTTHPAAP